MHVWLKAVANVVHPYTFRHMIMYLYAPLLSLFVVFASTADGYAGGDKEYGEYLSSECVTCHQSKNTDTRIPVLNGYDEEGFIALMEAYRASELENPTMITVAKRLTDEEISALAAYFSSLPEPE